MKTTTLEKGFTTVIRTTFTNRAQALFNSMIDTTELFAGSAPCPARQEVADHHRHQLFQNRLQSFRATGLTCN
jgi:hypothetical protein